MDQIKYLGAIVSEDLCDNLDIAREVRNTYAHGNSVIKCFRHCTTGVKALLFKTFCSGIYCSQLMKLEYKASISESMLQNGVDGFGIC